MISCTPAEHDMHSKRIFWSKDVDMMDFLQGINVGNVIDLAGEIVFDKLNEMKLDSSDPSKLIRIIIPIVVNTTVGVMRVMFHKVLFKMLMRSVTNSESSHNRKDITTAAINNIYHRIASEEEGLNSNSCKMNTSIMLLVIEVVNVGVFAPMLTMLELVVEKELSSNVFVFKNMDEEAFGKEHMYNIEEECIKRGVKYVQNEEIFKIPLGKKNGKEMN